jgi:hypothetical protein
MRKANRNPLNAAIYARIREVQMSAADRQHAIDSLRQAEAIAEAFLWLKEKLAGIGHFFLKPSLKH